MWYGVGARCRGSDSVIGAECHSERAQLSPVIPSEEKGVRLLIRQEDLGV
jgi:hypothetical protein